MECSRRSQITRLWPCSFLLCRLLQSLCLFPECGGDHWEGRMHAPEGERLAKRTAFRAAMASGRLSLCCPSCPATAILLPPTIFQELRPHRNAALEMTKSKSRPSAGIRAVNNTASRHLALPPYHGGGKGIDWILFDDIHKV